MTKPGILPKRTGKQQRPKVVLGFTGTSTGWEVQNNRRLPSHSSHFASLYLPHSAGDARVAHASRCPLTTLWVKASARTCRSHLESSWMGWWLERAQMMAGAWSFLFTHGRKERTAVPTLITHVSIFKYSWLAILYVHHATAPTPFQSLT